MDGMDGLRQSVIPPRAPIEASRRTQRCPDAVLVAVGDMEEVADPILIEFDLQGPQRRCEFAQIQGQVVLDVRCVKRCCPPQDLGLISAEDPTQGVPRGFHDRGVVPSVELEGRPSDDHGSERTEHSVHATEDQEDASRDDPEDLHPREQG